MKRLLMVVALPVIVAGIAALILLATKPAGPGSDHTLVHGPTFISYVIPIAVLGLMALGILALASLLVLAAEAIWRRWLRRRSQGEARP
jgi:membrane protein implicated in regulation of membrane protease activity